jgi:thiol:disulfide interchange protein/DsbC/DsbD-like thiol-disulfide interchange protein
MTSAGTDAVKRWWAFQRTNAAALTLLVGMLALALLPAPVKAQGFQRGEEVVPATLIAESNNVAPGETVTLAFLMQPKPTWHGYWRNPGDAGIGQSFAWTLPAGVNIVGEPRYPVPETLLISGIMNYVYEHDFAVLVDVKLAETLAPGTRLPLAVASEWLACTDEVCVPAKGEMTTTLTVAAKGTRAARDSRFDAFRMALPKPLGSAASYQVEDGTIRIAVPYPAEAPLNDPYFFIQDDGVIDYGAPQNFARDGQRLVITTQARENAPDSIDGVLKIGPDQGLSLTATKGSVAAAVGGANGAGDAGGVSGGVGGGDLSLLLLSLGGAILGGLLLNLMPCVFPILSLKALSLAKAGGDERSARRDALAYTAGVVLMASALGAVLLALRASGAAVGWAFQLQDARVIFLLLILVTGIAFNLAGLFELPTLSFGGKLADQGGTAGSFWTGALAAFVATPCTGPFMAVALGATIVLPPVAALIIFAGLGLGLALPFLLIAYVPALRARLPKPGPWLDGFRKVMSVPMFLTAVALIWLLAGQVSADALALLLIALLGAVLALWVYGSGQAAGEPRGWIAGGAAAIASITGALMVPTGASAPTRANSTLAASSSTDATLPAQPFSEAMLAQYRAENRPVFAYFTADWCITCKANEAAAIQRDATAKAFAKANVAVLVGDWTRPDPAISRFLEAHGRAGVPLYIWYAPGAEGQILPQILTVDMLTQLPVRGARTASRS